MIKLRLKNDILKSVFYMHFLYFYIYIYIYIKISKHLLAKYYQENKATLQKKKKACQRYQNLSKEEKEVKVTIGS